MTGKFTAKIDHFGNNNRDRSGKKANFVKKNDSNEDDHLTKLNLEIGLGNDDPDALLFLNSHNEVVGEHLEDSKIPERENSDRHARPQHSYSHASRKENDVADMPIPKGIQIPCSSPSRKYFFIRKFLPSEPTEKNYMKKNKEYNDKNPLNSINIEIASDNDESITDKNTAQIDSSNDYIHGGRKLSIVKRLCNHELSICSDASTVRISQTLQKPKYILLPHSEFRSAWDFYMSLVLIYIAIFVPYRVSFWGDLTGFLKYLDIFIDSSFGIDIILNFFTAYDIPEIEKYECRLKKIALRYLKGFFILDFIATFPFDLILRANSKSSEINGLNQASKLTKLPKMIKFLRVARLLKLLRVHRLQQIIRYVELHYNVHQGFSRLVNIVGTIMIATHLVGCLWHAIGVDLDVEKSKENCPSHFEDVEYSTIDSEFEGGWVCREGLSKASDWHKYAASVYWAFSTLTTVGYGDISARTVAEQCFSMIMMLLGVSWYAYVVGSMTTIISSFDRQNKHIRYKMMQVNTFLQEAKIPAELGAQIRKYFEYSLSKKSNGLFGYDADQILSELSSTLRIDVITHVEAKLIKSIPFFEGKSSTFVANAIQCFQPIVVHEGDFIIKEGSAADEMYFLIKGNAVVLYGNKKVKVMEAGSYFGEIGCILGGIRRASIMAESSCELQCLSKRNLNMLLGQHPEVGEDLKIVARERMNIVRKKHQEKVKKKFSPMPATDEVGEKKKSQKETELKSKLTKAKVIDDEKLSTNHEMASLEVMKFEENINNTQIGDTTEAFLELRADLAIDARRLSLTSGQLKSGSHKKADEKLIAKLNNDERNLCDDKADAKIYDEIIKLLSNDKKDRIQCIIATSVISLAETKMKDFTKIIFDNNEVILKEFMSQLHKKN